MATSYVAGFGAYLLSMDSTLTPTQIAKIIDEKALKDVLGGIREFFFASCHVWSAGAEESTPPVAPDTANRLLNSGL